MFTSVAAANAGVVYDNIPSPQPGNVVSLGFQATQTAEFGGQVELDGTERQNPAITVLMSSWACETGGGVTCDTTPGSTFSHPITLRLHAVGAGDSVGAQIDSLTESFDIPYRPSAHPDCGGGAWSPDDGDTCFNGLATPITFDLSGRHVLLPDKVIVSVAYNTQTWGAEPIGVPGPYNSLNVGVTSPPAVGSLPVPDASYWNTSNGPWYCDGGAGGVGTFRLDSCGWTGLQPAFRIEAETVPFVVNDDTTGPGPEGADCSDPDFSSVQAAIAAVPAESTILVCAGTYIGSAQLVIDRDLTLIGAGMGQTILEPGFNTGSNGDPRGWFLVNAGTSFGISELSLDGRSDINNVWQGIRVHGESQVDSVDFTNIRFGTYNGTAIGTLSGSEVSVTDSTFTNIGRIGVNGFGDGEFVGNTYVGKGDGDHLDYALDLGGGAEWEVADNTVTNNTGVASSDGSSSAGFLVSTFHGAGTTASFTGNTILDNTTGIFVGFNDLDTSTVTAHHNRIVGNDGAATGIHTTNPDVDAENNWWGCNDGPGAPGCDTVGASGGAAGTVDADPWLVLSAEADPTTIGTGGAQSEISAAIDTNSDGDPAGPVPDGTPISFATSLGSVAPTSGQLDSGGAETTLTSGPVPGVAEVTSTVDNEGVPVAVTFVGAPVNSSAPVVTGQSPVGSELACLVGVWEGSGISYQRQWLRDGADIGGETASTYVTVPADVGAAISCRVTASSAAGSASETSNSITVTQGPANAVAPSVSGPALVGNALSCELGTWTGTPAPALTRQWLRDGNPIGGETGAEYTSSQPDVGRAISCRVTATNSVGQASETSNAITVIQQRTATRPPRLTRFARKPLRPKRRKARIARLACGTDACVVETRVATLNVKGRLFTTAVRVARRVGANRTVPVRVILPKAGRRSLTAARRGVVRLQLTIRTSAGQRFTRSIRVRVRG